MSDRTARRRLDHVEQSLTPPCRTCYGQAFAIVLVPDGEDDTAPAWNPTHCRECGVPLRTVQRIIGIHDTDMDGETVQRATP